MPQPRGLPDNVPVAWMTTRQLKREGFTERAIAVAVATGDLIRVRRGRYLPRGAHPAVVCAAALGGRIDCVTLLRLLGVFVFDQDRLHLQVTNGSSRLPRRPANVVAHWRPTRSDPQAAVADVIEALAQSVRCQAPRAAIATVDSALHLGVVTLADVEEAIGRLPERFRPLLGLIDGRSESGPESLVRLMLRGLGCRVDLQVRIARVGRVDFVVDGWLIVECDSEAFHSSWEQRKRDLRRDLAAAALGYTTVRLLAEDILYRPDEVVDRLRETLSTPALRRS